MRMMNKITKIIILKEFTQLGWFQHRKEILMLKPKNNKSSKMSYKVLKENVSINI